MDRTILASPDSLTGFVRVADADGVDSFWIVIDTMRYGDDGLLNTAVEGRYNLPIAPNLAPSTQLPVRVEGRDILGYVSTLDTFVIIN